MGDPALCFSLWSELDGISVLVPFRENPSGHAGTSWDWRACKCGCFWIAMTLASQRICRETPSRRRRCTPSSLRLHSQLWIRQQCPNPQHQKFCSRTCYLDICPWEGTHTQSVGPAPVAGVVRAHSALLLVSRARPPDPTAAQELLMESKTWKMPLTGPLMVPGTS